MPPAPGSVESRSTVCGFQSSTSPLPFGATANCRPSGLKVTAVIPWRPGNTASGSAVVRDQILAVPSYDPEASVFPSGPNASDKTGPSWPMSSHSIANVRAFHRRMWPFLAPLAI